MKSLPTANNEDAKGVISDKDFVETLATGFAVHVVDRWIKKNGMANHRDDLIGIAHLTIASGFTTANRICDKLWQLAAYLTKAIERDLADYRPNAFGPSMSHVRKCKAKGINAKTVKKHLSDVGWESITEISQPRRRPRQGEGKRLLDIWLGILECCKTERERKVAEYLYKGRFDKITTEETGTEIAAIANDLGVTPRTIRGDREKIKKRFYDNYSEWAPKREGKAHNALATPVKITTPAKITRAKQPIRVRRNETHQSLAL